MVVVLVLGAFVIHQFSHGNYVLALAEALLVIAGILLALSWLWDPRAGFAGIGQVMNRYFMSVGMPFERWMHSLANLADQERDPDKFVMTAADDMAALPWVSGIDWQTATQRGVSGHITRHATECRLGPLRLTVYTRWSPVRPWCCISACSRVCWPTTARPRSAAGLFSQRVHARYLRNRLAPDSRCEEPAIAALIVCRRRQQRQADARHCACRQLPGRQRRRPRWTSDRGGGPDHQSAGTGGASCSRATHDASCSVRPAAAGLEIPADLFDRVAENCLQALETPRCAAPRSRCTAVEDGVELSVCDSGEALPESSRARCSPPVPSRQGLGWGCTRHPTGEHWGITSTVAQRTLGMCFCLEARTCRYEPTRRHHPADRIWGYPNYLVIELTTCGAGVPEAWRT